MITFPKRRWLRFSVRTLLIAVTLLCLWLGWRVNHYRQHNAAKARLDAIGAGVSRIGWSEVRPDWWIRETLLSKVGVTRAGFDYFLELVGIRDEHTMVVCHPPTGVSRVFPELGNLCSVSFIAVRNTDVTDADLRYLEPLTELCEFRADDTSISDEGLRLLAKEKSLLVLYLRGTRITADGIRELRSLKDLHTLHIPRSEENAAAVAELKSHLRHLSRGTFLGE